jgi:ABC-type multidrug transport system ATPase subunit
MQTTSGCLLSPLVNAGFISPQSLSRSATDSSAEIMTRQLWQLDRVLLRGQARPRIDHVSCRVESGVTAIVGYSGAGKTSLLNLLAGMESPNSGVITVGSATEKAEAAQLDLFWAPQGGGLWPHLDVQGHLKAVASGKNTTETADKLLDEFDLYTRRAAFPDQLSQGEKARLSVARALFSGAAVLLFDEPLAHVDQARRSRYWQSIRRHIESTGSSLVFSSHDPDVILREADAVLCLAEGKLVYSGSVQSLYQNPPDRLVGSFLGPMNWFEPSVADWIEGADSDAPGETVSLRPEQIQLVVDPTSVLQVSESTFCGSYAETLLRHTDTGVEQLIIHRPAGNVCAGGDRVRLRKAAQMPGAAEAKAGK